MKSPIPQHDSPTPAAAPSRRKLVLLAGRLDALLAPGGGEIQMLATAGALPRADVDAWLWRPWEDSLADADCLHLFGSLPGHLGFVEAARRYDVPVALSTIAWFELADCWREPGNAARRLAVCGRFLARTACPRLPSWRKRLYDSVDLLLPNSNAEAEQLMRYFRIPSQKIHIVPNGADPSFAEADPAAFAEMVGAEGFVLYPGRIEPRKNQLGFLEAVRGVETPVVMLGDAVPGCEGYLEVCRRAAGPSVQFVPRLEHDDPRLASAYAACGCVVLASWFETPGLVALEAGMSGTPLVLPEGGCAREYFGEHALYVQPEDKGGIRRAVLAALERGRSETLAEHVRRNFSWDAAARATAEAYGKIE